MSDKLFEELMLVWTWTSLYILYHCCTWLCSSCTCSMCL